MSDAKTGEILWINTLKGACILLVVLYHVISPGFENTLHYLSAGTLIARAWIAFNDVVSPLRMPAFFFVSGLLAARAILYKPWREVFTSRVTNLFYLYLLWGTIQWLSIYGISTGITGQRLSDNINAAWAQSPQQFIELMLVAMSSAWYLYALALFFLLAKLFSPYRLPLLAAALLLNYAALANIFPGWGLASLAQYFVYFLVGVFYSREIIHLSEWRRGNMGRWLLLLVLALGHIWLGIEKSLFLCLLAIAMCIALARWLNQFLDLSWLNWVGRNTLQIYVLHRIFLEYFAMTAILFALQHQLFSYPLFSLLWAVGFPLAMVALCSACSMAIWTLLNRGMGKSLFIYPKLLRMKFHL